MDRIIKRSCAEVFDIAVILAGGMKTFVPVPAESVEQAKLLAQKNGFELNEKAAK